MGKAVESKDLRLSIDARLSRELFKLVELDLFSIEEAKKVIARHQTFQHGAMSIRDKPRKLEAYLHWLTFLIALQCIIKQRISQPSNKDADDEEKARAQKLSVGRRDILSAWFNLVYRLLKRWHHDFDDDLRVDLTILDYLLKSGATRLFDKHINKALVNNPRHFDLWMLAIDRQRQAGNLQAALRLCQKAHRFHKDQDALNRTLENLALAAVLGNVIAECQDEAVDESAEETAAPSGDDVETAVDEI